MTNVSHCVTLPRHVTRGSSAIVILAISPDQSNNKIDYLDYPLGPGKIILFTRIIDDNAREKRLFVGFVSKDGLVDIYFISLHKTKHFLEFFL